MNLKHPFSDPEWPGFRSSEPGHRNSAVKVTSYEERTSEPLVPASSQNRSFTSQIEIKGIRPRPFSPAMRMMMTDPFFSMTLPRVNSRPHNVKLSVSSRSSRFPTDSSGYGSGSSSSSVFEDPHDEVATEPTPSESGRSSCDSVIRAKPKTPVVRDKSESFDSKGSLKDSLVRALDELDARVSFLRETANELKEEKQKLLFALHAIEQHSQLNQIELIDREEVITNTNRLLLTLETVAVSVTTRRSAEQAAANQCLNELLDFLEKNLNSNNVADREEAVRMAKIFLNTCSSETDSRVEIDEKFQKQVIDCAGDDQKRARRRLENIVRSYINSPLSSSS